MINKLKNLFGFGEVADLSQLVKEGAVIVDVRSKGEYQSGHFKNAINIPLDVLPNHLSKLDKTKPIITCCASGMRSSNAESLLKSYGFTDVYNGGSWVSLKKFEA